MVERDENNHARKRNLPPSQVPRRIAKRVAAMVAVIDKVGPFRGNALGEVDGMALSRAYHGSELKRFSRAVAANYQTERRGHKIVTIEILWVFENLAIHRSKQTVAKTAVILATIEKWPADRSSLPNRLLTARLRQSTCQLETAILDDELSLSNARGIGQGG